MLGQAVPVGFRRFKAFLRVSVSPWRDGQIGARTLTGQKGGCYYELLVTKSRRHSLDGRNVPVV